MELRIKPINKHDTLYWYVQIKKGWRWKNLDFFGNWKEAKDLIDNLKRVDEENNKLNTTKRLSFNVYGVRQRMRINNDFSNKLEFYTTKPYMQTNTSKATCGLWVTDGYNDEIGSLKIKEWFGELVTEPKLFKITIEEIS